MKPILNLTIKRKWLEMIVSGEKREEYRAPNCAQLRDWGEPDGYHFTIQLGRRVEWEARDA